MELNPTSVSPDEHPLDVLRALTNDPRWREYLLATRGIPLDAEVDEEAFAALRAQMDELVEDNP